MLIAVGLHSIVQGLSTIYSRRRTAGGCLAWLQDSHHDDDDDLPLTINHVPLDVFPGGDRSGLDLGQNSIIPAGRF